MEGDDNMNTASYTPLPVLLIDDESQALDSFEIALSSGKMNNFVRCQDSRDVMSMLANFILAFCIFLIYIMINLSSPWTI